MKTLRSWLEQKDQIFLTMHISPTSSYHCSYVELEVSFQSQHPDHESVRILIPLSPPPQYVFTPSRSQLLLYGVLDHDMTVFKG